jgi:pimeloyl-ACP methyl ester carboxylesterase
VAEHRIAYGPHSAEVHVSTDGSGPAVLLLAGTGHDATDWERAGYVAGLRGRYRTVAIDLPGQGLSAGSREAAAYRLGPMLAVLDAVADYLRLPAFAILGYSLGGSLALQAAGRLRRVRLAVAIGAASGQPLDPQVAARASEQALAVHRAKVSGRLDRLGLTPAQRLIADRMDIPAHIATLAGAATWPRLDVSQLACPRLLYLGAADDVAGPAALPGAGLHVHVQPALDHESVFEQAGSALRVIGPFLARHAPW